MELNWKILSSVEITAVEETNSLALYLRDALYARRMFQYKYKRQRVEGQQMCSMLNLITTG